MCGISGWINWNGNKDLLKEIDVIKKMNNSILHRGPDEGGFWTSSNALIGHRRLIVLDAEGGKQPMEYKVGDKSIVLCYNGELYNYKEVRKELEELGYKFKSESDTEVVLIAYVEWGELCPKKFNGMFAFAVFDEVKSRLFFARDHLGVKPLFYCTRGDSILFGSEIKVLLSNEQLVQPIVDEKGIAQLFYIGSFRTPETGCIFKDIHELGSGKSITFINNGDGSFTSKGEFEYWSLKSYRHTDNLETTVEKVKELLQSSLSRQLVSDVPITFLLSGGLASNTLVSLASSLAKSSSLPNPSPINKDSILKTFSIEFEGDSRSFKETLNHENPYGPSFIQKVVDQVKSNHETTECNTVQLLDSLYFPMRARDLPSLGKGETSLRLLLKKVKQQGVVLISDEGSDEIFSGYDWFDQTKFLNLQRLPWIGEIYADFNQYLKDEILELVDYNKFGEIIYNNAIKKVPHVKGENDMDRKLRIQSFLFIKYFLHYMLEREDRISMSNSLEVRVPYCDYKLVEYCFNIPHSFKQIDDVEKGILRRSMVNNLPKDILYHTKNHYKFEIKNLEYFYGICDILKPILQNSNSPVLQFIKPDPIINIINNKIDKTYQTHNIQLLIEHLIQVNQWIIEYKIKFV